MLYGVVFLVTGAVLLTIGYFLVRSNLEAHENFPVSCASWACCRPGTHVTTSSARGTFHAR